ncbi:MAG: penicillin acylase family protein [Gemmataceae bacterium]
MSWLRTLMGLLLGNRLPTVRGDLTVRGLEKPIVIRRTKHGIPCIEAENDIDASFGIGFVHAQDRGFQLETILRISRGTLAELVGPKGLPIDRMSRRIGFRRAGQAKWPKCDPDIRAAVAAYAAGVNAGFAQGLSKKPHEFTILKAEPTVWEPEDVLAFGTFQSFMLPGNWDVELARLKILRADGPDAVAALDPSDPLDRHVHASSQSSASVDVIDRLLHDLHQFQSLAPAGGGSNNWVLHGSRTKTGQPILSNDPHLHPTLPAPWYLLQIRTPEWAVAGATFAGSPAIPVGHNEQCAWGVTAGLTDNTDLFLETLGPDGETVREADGQFHRHPVVEEVIRVKGEADVVERVVMTPRGPIVSPIFPGVHDAVSMSAVWLQPLPIRGFLSVQRADNFESFRKPFEHWPILPLSVVFADRTGTVGYQLIGQLPVRRSGNGMLPLPGDGPNAGWSGLVPFREMPTGTNPECGFYATANSAPPASTISHANGTPPYLGNDFVDPYRTLTILDELGKRTDWDVASCQQLHLSVRSLPWEQMREIVLATPVRDADAVQGLAVLKEWNGQVSADSAGAAVYELFLSKLIIRLAKAKAPNAWAVAVGGSETHEFLTGNTFVVNRVRHLIALLQSKPEGWFAEGWDRTIEASLTDAVKWLHEKSGPGPRFWNWGHFRPLIFAHTLFGKHPLLSKIFNIGPLPSGGDQNTINQAATGPLEVSEPTSFMPNLRTVFDLSNWSNSRFVLAGGQSGNPCSAHFDDLLPLWKKGEGVAIPFTREEVLKDATISLRLMSR